MAHELLIREDGRSVRFSNLRSKDQFRAENAMFSTGEQLKEKVLQILLDIAA